MKCTLYFATKLNSRDILKCNFWGVPSYDLDPSNQEFLDPPLESNITLCDVMCCFGGILDAH